MKVEDVISGTVRREDFIIKRNADATAAESMMKKLEREKLSLKEEVKRHLSQISRMSTEAKESKSELNELRVQVTVRDQDLKVTKTALGKAEKRLETLESVEE